LDVQVIYRPALSASYAVLKGLFLIAVLIMAALLIRHRILYGSGASSESWIPLLLCLLVLFISAPLFARYVIYGHDTLFHMRRIANLAEEVFSGRIPARIAQTWKNGYGYPVSIFYGDIFMLEAAVLFRLGVPLWRCYQFYLLSVNAATVVFSYHCFRRLSGSAWAGAFGSVLYAASVRYLANMYLRGAIGEATAMAFLPVAVTGFYELFAETADFPADGTVTPARGESVDARPLAGRFRIFNRRAVPYLVCGFTALIQSHTLTTIQGAVFAALFCLLFVRRLLRNGRLMTLAVSAGLTLLVNLWFIVPFCDYYLRHVFFARHAAPVAESAVKLSELLFPEELFRAIGKGTLLLLVLAIACAVVLHVRRVRAKEPVPSYARGVAACETLSVLAVWMGTEVFPWAWMETHLPFVYGVLGGRIQYVWRYFSLATLLTVVTAMLVARAGEYKRTVPLLACLLLVLTCAESAVMLHTAYHPAPDTPVLRAADVWNSDGGDALYMFDDLVWHDVPRAEVMASEGVTVSEVSHEGTTYRCMAENVSAKDAFAEFPVWNYYGYVAKTDGGQPLAVSDGEGHRVRVTIPAGFSGHLTVGFREPWYWRMAEAVSVAAFILIICVIHRKYDMI
ncbi:MAG: hypothetical protein IJQ21_03760, partial [Lachnospiraceae bacterium]|nr:hypothetical protein [Lachnospiraceae bacterium]